jgi:hypothetical protein
MFNWIPARPTTLVFGKQAALGSLAQSIFFDGFDKEVSFFPCTQANLGNAIKIMKKLGCTTFHGPDNQHKSSRRYVGFIVAHLRDHFLRMEKTISFMLLEGTCGLVPL